MESKHSNKAIAVLPFVNMSSSEDNEYFSDGITEEIINALAGIDGLKVTSRTSSFYFKNKNIPIPQIGRELNVSIILEGSVRLAGNKMRITAQLIDVQDDFHFWSETFDRSLDDIFAVQDEISLLIADKLREHLGHFNIKEHLVEAPGIPVEVYKKYLKGRFHLMQLDLPGTQKGITIFKEVIASQPDFPLPYLDINQGYAYLGTMGLIPAQEAFLNARPFLEKAIELDEESPEVQLNLAWIACWQNWDIETAYKHLNNALEVRPSDQIYLTIANTLTLERKYKAAMNYIDKALQLDPFYAMNHHFKGFIYYLEENYEAAFPHFEKSRSLKPELIFPMLYKGLSLILMGRAKEGLWFFQNMPPDKGGDLSKLGGTTLAYAALGDLDNVEKGVQKLEAALQTDSMGSAMNFLIFIKTKLGLHDEAMDLIEKSKDFRLPITLLYNSEPFLKPLRAIDRFKQLMQAVFGDYSIQQGIIGKYKKPSLDEKEGEKYYEKLLQTIKEDQPFLQPGLSLRDLASMIDLHPNKLSELLNEKVGKNFSGFINHYRVEMFKKMVTDPQNAHLSILGIAFESGFNSKTAFNTFFKKETGMTPKQYLKNT